VEGAVGRLHIRMNEENRLSGSAHITLDCSWVDAVLMIMGAIFCALLAVGLVWATLNGHWPVQPMSYTSAAFFAAYALFLLISIRNRSVRFALFVLLLAEGIRLAVSLTHTSFGIQRTATLVNRWVMITFLVGCLAYILVWFKQRIRRV
jgi:hypothetical protein